MEQQNKFGSLEDIINSIIPLDELVNKVFIGQDRTRLFKYHFTFDLETTNKLIDGLSKLGVVGMSQEFALASITNYIGEEANKRRSDMLTKREDTSMSDPYINIGGTYVEGIRALGVIPEEYTLPLALRGIGMEMNKGGNSKTYIDWIKAALETNPELGYLALTSSPRGNDPIHYGSMYYYLQSTLVGILMSYDLDHKSIKEGVDICDQAIKDIVEYSRSPAGDDILGLTPNVMINIAVDLAGGYVPKPEDIEWDRMSMDGITVFGSGASTDTALDHLMKISPRTDITFDANLKPLNIQQAGRVGDLDKKKTDMEFLTGKEGFCTHLLKRRIFARNQDIIDYPTQLDSNPCLDTLVTYNGKQVTKREALECLIEKVKALVKDMEVDFFSVGSLKSAITNVSTTTGMSEDDIMLVMGKMDEAVEVKMEYIKRRTGGLRHLDPCSKSGIGLKEITDAIAEGKPVSVVMDDSEMSINPKRFVVLGAGGPRISGNMGLISDLHHGHYKPHWSEDVHSDYNKGDVFVTKSSRDEIIQGKNRTWPKAKSRKGHK